MVKQYKSSLKSLINVWNSKTENYNTDYILERVYLERFRTFLQGAW